MEVYDPHVHVNRHLEDCERIAQVSGLIPVLSPTCEQWFVVNMLSGESMKIEDLEPAELGEVLAVIATHRVTKLLLNHCHQVRDDDDAPNRASAALTRYALATQHSESAVNAAEESATRLGFTEVDITQAYNLIERTDVLKDVPVVKVSDLRSGEDEA